MSSPLPFARRDFLLHTVGAAALLAGCASNPGRRNEPPLTSATHYPATLALEQDPPLKPASFGWKMLAIEPGRQVPLRWGTLPASQAALLRIILAREARPGGVIEVVSAASQQPVGRFDIRFGYTLQTFQVPLDEAAMAEARAGGLVLRHAAGKEPIWIIAEADPPPETAPPVPHLLIGDHADRREALLSRLRSLNSFHYSGWMQGCVLDALRDLHRETGDGRFLAALSSHMEAFLASDAATRANVPGGLTIRTIEATLPAAVIARYRPNEPWLDQALAFWAKRRDSEGCVQDGTTTSAEGSYTIAYPMAVLADARNDPALYDAAITQLLRRRERLAQGDDIHLRMYGSNAEKRLYMKNWSRGIAWYYLGLVRTLIELPLSRRPVELTDECRRVADLLLAKRTPGGLWHCYAGEPGTGLETSGSAGITAGLALASKHHLLPPEYGRAAETTLRALWPHVTPDGFLTGVAQSNAGGEELQRGGYRVIAQFGAGLAGQLVAGRMGVMG